MSVSSLPGPSSDGNVVTLRPTNDLTDRIALHFSKGYPGTIPPNQALEYVTRTYLDSLDPADPPAPAEIEQRLLALTNGVYADDNERRKPGNRTPLLRRLTPYQIAQCLLRLHHVIEVALTDPKQHGPLAVYVADGPEAGTYSVDEESIRGIAARYDTQMSINDAREVLAILRRDAPRIQLAADHDLLAVNNGILNYRTKQLQPFSPRHVLLVKCPVDYRVHAGGAPIITRPDGTTWDVETWMAELSDDPERVDLGWHLLGACIRPLVRWDKAVLLYNTHGNNGKGTFMALARSLVGPSGWGTMSIADFDTRFRMAGVVGKSVVGADENNVGAFAEQMANFKAYVTGDQVLIERKNQDPYLYQPSGLTIQCLNSLPKAKDISDSYYRRLLFWEFDKSFAGREDKAIKQDYLHRRDVLEYVLWRTINLPDYYVLPEPASSAAVLAEFRVANDPVREFWDEIASQLVWDLQPQDWLHALYGSWSERTNPRGGSLKRREFYSRLKQIVEGEGGWEDGQFATSTHMLAAEPLAQEYRVDGWGWDADRRIATPLHTKPKYRGLRRAGGAQHPAHVALTAIVDEVMSDVDPE